MTQETDQAPAADTPGPDDLQPPPDPMGGMMQLTLEEAHSEALELIGEQQVTIRVLSKRLRTATLMLQAQQQAAAAPPPLNREQRRAAGRNGKGRVEPPA